MPDDQAALLTAHLPGLRRFARALSRGDRARADDLVQDSLERALAHWQERRAEGSLHGWLCTIVYNRFVSEERRRRRRGVELHLAETGEAELPEVDGGQDAALRYRDFLRAFRTLPEDQRSVLLLVGVDNLSYREAAQTLGVPIGTVMSRLSRARDRLRREPFGWPPDRPPRRARAGKALVPE